MRVGRDTYAKPLPRSLPSFPVEWREDDDGGVGIVISPLTLRRGHCGVPSLSRCEVGHLEWFEDIDGTNE